MTFKKAQNIVCTDFSNFPAEKLQKYKVNVIDAWRYARGDYGYNNDFFVYIGEVKAFVPRDKWLLKNIESIMDKLNI